ncbi:ABC-type transport auxiliary lipoprotein family protein [Desulforegula conservatrix]|uniref:ABC-type transport auxiliary lipoprotein family protein n=1 Tax=Desulforegula conservatrix TaxID=153026 RepID=UPI0003F930B3|nr:ABC-type transport auxiliary lipoprotein family protein [Desulforegula conservatrix]
MKNPSKTKVIQLVLAVLISCLVLPGCVKLSKPYPIKQYFVLEAKRTAQTGGAAPKASIRIKDPEISPLFSSKSFVYKTSNLEFKTDFYNEFFILPDKLIKTQTVEWLKKSGAFRRISPDPGEKTDFILESNIVNLYIDKTTSPNKAVLETAFFLLSGTKGADEIIWHSAHREEVQVKDDSSPAMAEAFSKSLENTLIFLENNLIKSVYH